MENKPQGPCSRGEGYFKRTVKGKEQSVVCPKTNWEARKQRQVELAQGNLAISEAKSKSKLYRTLPGWQQ